MTYLYNKDVNVLNANAIVSTSNPFPVTAVGDGLEVKGISPDAFGRTRVSELFTLGDYKHLFAIDPNFLDVTSNGTVTFEQNKAAATLATLGTNTSAYAIHQTKFYHHYQPGKSQLIFSSFVFGAPERNVTKRTGYFDDRDGIYFEQVGSDTADGTVSNTTQTLNWVIRSYTGNTANESNIVTTVNGQPYTYKRRVPQSEWNRDKCDGTGLSGFNLDITKTQLTYTDFQWLGVGRVRCGFVHDGKIIIAHEYYNSNVLDEVYIANPNLPVRCEVRNTGPGTGGSFDQICSTVASEGGYVESGIDFAITANNRSTATPSATELPLVAIRLKNSFQGFPNRISVRLNQIALHAETNSIVYEVRKLANSSYLANNTGALVWTSASASSGVEYCINADTITNGESFASGFVPAGASQNSLSPVASGALTAAKKNIIVQNFDSTNSEVYVVVVRTITTAGNQVASVGAALQWREIY